MSKTEEKTIRKAAAGDRLAFRDLVLEHSHAIFRLAWRLTGDRVAADDIVQEAFIKAWQNVGNFRMDSSFRSWISRITVNTAMDYLRKQSGMRPAPRPNRNGNAAQRARKHQNTTYRSISSNKPMPR